MGLRRLLDFCRRHRGLTDFQQTALSLVLRRSRKSIRTKHALMSGRVVSSARFNALFHIQVVDRSADTVRVAATLRRKLQTKLAITPSHGTLTPGRHVLALTLQGQTPSRVATKMPNSKALIPTHRGANLGPPVYETDTFTSRPSRWATSISVGLLIRSSPWLPGSQTSPLLRKNTAVCFHPAGLSQRQALKVL